MCSDSNSWFFGKITSNFSFKQNLPASLQISRANQLCSRAQIKPKCWRYALRAEKWLQWWPEKPHMRAFPWICGHVSCLSPRRAPCHRKIIHFLYKDNCMKMKKWEFNAAPIRKSSLDSRLNRKPQLKGLSIAESTYGWAWGRSMQSSMRAGSSSEKALGQQFLSQPVGRPLDVY